MFTSICWVIYIHIHNAGDMQGSSPVKSSMQLVRAAPVEMETGENVYFEDSDSFYLCPPWIALLEVISTELVPQASFSQAHYSLSYWMLCWSLVAPLALILCEGFESTNEEGSSPWQDKPRVSGGENQEKGFENGCGVFGTRRREICVRFFSAVHHRPKVFAQLPTHPKHVFHARFHARFGTASRFPLRSPHIFETPRAGKPLRLRDFSRLPLLSVP